MRGSLRYHVRMTPPSTPRRLLVLVHEFPPAGGGGVQRIAKFCRYLPEFGWEPTVVTTSLIEGRPTDVSLLADVDGVPVTRLPHRDVATAVARVLAPFKRGRGQASRPNAKTSSAPANAGTPARRPLSARIASWIAVPDGAVRWARSAEKTAADPAFGDFDAVLASGPPHSTLVAGARVAASRDIPYVADLRDAWAGYPGRTLPTSWHRSRDERLEREVMSRAAVVTAASDSFADEARSYGATRAVTITNGYDAADLPERPTREVGGPHSGGLALRLAFMGRFYATTDPTSLFEGIARARAEGVEVTLDVVGPDAPAARATAESLGLGDAVRFLGYQPHARALEIVAEADVAVLTLAALDGTAGVYPGKVFEYLGMGMPVLLVGPPEGVSAHLVREAGAGEVVRPDDPAAVADALRRLAEKTAAGTLPTPEPAVLSRFERRTLARELARELDEAVTAR